MPQTWATTAALAANITVEQPNAPTANLGEGAATPISPAKDQPNGTDMSQSSTLCLIAEMLAAILQGGKLDTLTKQSVVKVIKIAREAETKELDRELSSGEIEKVSAIHLAIQSDLVGLHDLLDLRICEVQEDCKKVLENTNKVLSSIEKAKTDTKDLASKVNKVTDTTDKLAANTNSYWSVLLSKPVVSNKTATNPRVLNNMDQKAKQILVDIYNKDDNNVLSKSLTYIVEKANETIAGLQCASKPKDIKVVLALKIRGKAVLLTLNSKEAVTWIREPLNETEFSNSFSAESQIRERSYNLIAPRVPITFDPSNEKHLHKLEETNCLDKHTIRREKWIKPVARRRSGQANAYAILTLSSVNTANTLIRDGVYICSIKIRPTKQKQEPIQCMKCREWGHFTLECQLEKDVCRNCGEEHRTTECKNKSKLYCVACDKVTHASWSRACPEFNRRCQILDGRNPENAMPYFPTEHNWTLTVRPSSIPLEDRFPARFTVNMLPTMGSWQQVPRTCQQHRGQRYNAKDRNGCNNPNRIQIPPNREREEGELPVGGAGWYMGPNTGGFTTDKTTLYNLSGWD